MSASSWLVSCLQVTHCMLWLPVWASHPQHMAEDIQCPLSRQIDSKLHSAAAADAWRPTGLWLGACGIDYIMHKANMGVRKCCSYMAQRISINVQIPGEDVTDYHTEALTALHLFNWCAIQLNVAQCPSALHANDYISTVGVTANLC